MKRGIVDLSSVVWTCLRAGKDVEFGRKVMSDAGKEVFVNSAQYGYDNAINHITKAMEDLRLQPRDLILVKEGMNSKADRQAIHPAYKGDRGDKVPQMYEQFNICRDKLIDNLLGVGAQMCWQDGGVEGDDVIGYLCENLEGERTAISGDKDIAVVVSYGPDVHHYKMGALDTNPFGEFPHRFIPVYIALVGDSGDKIPGAKGFGDGAWLKLHALYGDSGLEAMETLIRTRNLKALEEDVGELRELQKIIDDQDGVYMSWELGRLRTNRVNTLRRPLQWKVGMVRPKVTCEEEMLRKYAGVNRIIGAEAFQAAKDWAAKQIRMSPYVTLDVETATPDESDEWLAAQGKEDKVDVFGSELTSLQITFGPNMQYTMYLPINNVEVPGVSNLLVDQVAEFLDTVPRTMITYVHNAAFELPVCYVAWGHLWQDDPDYHGFLRNVRDTAIASSYADENRSRGLKSLAKEILGYDQVSFDQLTIRDYAAAETQPLGWGDDWDPESGDPQPEFQWTFPDWDGKGKIIQTYLEPMIEDTGETEEVESGEVTVVETGEMVEVNGDLVPVMKSVPIMKTVPKMKHVGDRRHIYVQYKTSELKASEVVEYGCDDTIVTAALANHFNVIMELEKTKHVYDAVETFPAYLTALAFVQGTDISLEEMREMEKEDDEAYDKAWPVLRDFLMKIGFEGTVCPVMVDKAPDDAPSHVISYDPKGVKAAHEIITGRELKTAVRTMSKIAKLIEQEAEVAGENDVTSSALLLATCVAQGNISGINELIAKHFQGEPKLDLASPKQMQRLLYDFIGIPVKVINDVTVNEKVKNPDLDMAVRKFKKVRAGSNEVSLDDRDRALLRIKGKTDDTAIDFALAFDQDVIDDDARAALRAIGTMKKVMTRRSLFYKNYWKIRHWKDGKVHAYANQCAAVTRRYSMSNPNLQQLPKKGEGVKFRGIFKPHHKKAVICSIDFSGQELRLAAEVSQDKNMLACYVGDKLKDIHSITAAGAMHLKWGQEVVNELFATHGADLLRNDEGTYDLFVRIRKQNADAALHKTADDLRKEAKNVNFGAQNGAKAAKLSETLIMSYADAQLFLDAREKMFPDVDKAAIEISEEAMRTGYATTLMGARRHLAAAMTSDERGAADRAARQAWNYKIQGSAGEMTKLAMAEMWKRGLFFKYDARFIAPIHDELVDSVSVDDAVEFIREKHACMTQAYANMTVPILGSISVGPDFANQHECGDWFIEENIRKELGAIFQLKEAA